MESVKAYPVAAFAEDIRAESYSCAAHDAKAAAGRRAMERLSGRGGERV